MIRITRNPGILQASINLTASKSITNRVLIIRALTGGEFNIGNISKSNDSKILQQILSELSPEIDAQDAGTVFRFLIAYLSIQPGDFLLTGTQRMKQRPVGKLVDALNKIGANIQYADNIGYPPVRIRGRQLKGGHISIDASESSQFVSALLLIAPCLTQGFKIELAGKINSRPYILMTLSLMQYFGIKIKSEGSFISIPFQSYIPHDITIENDWSSASFWYLISGLSGMQIILRDLYKNSIQGDSIISVIMLKLGVETITIENEIILKPVEGMILPEKFVHNFSNNPDLVFPVAVYCAAKGIACSFSGVENLRIKESDRLSALKTELEKTGVNVTIDVDTINISGSMNLNSITSFNSHNDHRITMSLAALAGIFPGISIDSHSNVNKSYPEFWEQFISAGFTVDVS
jgi:3-phosphoshikimate 1-carboxyvinyltransferase